MSTHAQPSHRHNFQHMGASLLVCLIAVLVNIIGMQIVNAFGLPLYLDCVGTMVAAMLGGYLPGILVGYFTNLAVGTYDNITLYYAMLNVIIAVITTFARNRGWLKNVWQGLLVALAISLLCGSCTSVLEWGLDGMPMGGLTFERLYSHLWIDMLDKTLSLGLASLVVHVLPDSAASLFQMTLWQQEPLSKEELSAIRSVRSRVTSMRTKVVGIVVVLMVSVAIVTTLISLLMFNSSMVAEQEQNAYGVTNYMKNEIDPTRIDDFLKNGREAKGYIETEDKLRDIRKSFDKVQYVYAYRIEEDGCHVVLDPGSDEAPGDPVGSVIGFDDAFMPYLDDLLAGRPIDPIISDETYGWLLTVYQPLYNEDGTCACYVACDILMDHIISDGYAFITRVVALFIAFLILVCVIIFWFADYSIILPLNSIALATNGFAFDNADDRNEAIAQVNSLDVSTGDEIEHLYESVVKMTQDTVDYIAESQDKSATIERMQDNLIMVMADLVESRDQFTGDHVRKTAAYAQIIMDQMREEGAYADELTDAFVSDVVHSAPLHDIGKIVVSDTILNKPGRLTAEEFEVMKGHTTAGSVILTKAVDAVSEPTYLDEAKNLAEFHHEKWDGSGYPSGRAGLDIPLSARIMAVADVFDALVSKRSYKDGFPLEKAFAIIEEGMGTHFDPLIAKAFLDARDKAAAVARAYGDAE